MSADRKKPFPVVLLVITLILAVVFTAFDYPGFLLPFILPGNREVKVGKEGERFSEGHSKAFSVQPVEGVTISAEENALDKNRTFKMTEVSEEIFKQQADAYETDIQNPGMLMKLWELSAGLDDDEILPGKFRIDIDLDSIGIDESRYEDARVYRIDDNGTWYELVSSMEGSVLSTESNKNSLLGIVVIGGAVLGFPTALELIQSYTTDSYFMGDLKPSVDGFDLTVDNKKLFKLIINIDSVKYLVFENGNPLAIQDAHNRALRRAMVDAIKEDDSLSDVKKETALYQVPPKVKYAYAGDYIEKMFKDEYNVTKAQIDALKKRMMKLEAKYYKEELKKEDEYRKYENQLKAIKEDKRSLEELKNNFDQVKKVASYLEKAYFYLKDEEKVSVPTYKMDIHLAEKVNKNYGVTNYRVGNPYMVVYMNKVANGKKEQYDEMLLTITHEYFHACQREYVSNLRANFGFDETSAMAVEADAYEYFTDNGDINSTAHLGNMRNSQYFAVPLDSYSTVYPEGKIGGNDKTAVAYPRAPLIRYLRKHGAMSRDSYGTVLTRYKSLWGHRYLTTILKRCFLLSDRTLTSKYYDFAQEYQKSFLDWAEDPSKEGFDPVFSPEAYLKSSKADIELPNKSYTIRVRRIRIDHKNKQDNSYAIVIKESDGFKEKLSDMKLIPMKMEENKDYTEWKEGLFIYPKSFPEDMSEPVLYLMEVDGGTGEENDKAGGYTACVLIPPEAVTDITDDKLIIQPIKRPSYKENITDSVVVSAYLNKQRVLFEQIKYEGWNTPYTIDLSGIKIDGTDISEEQLAQLKIQIQECVKGTYEETGENTCLGPETVIQRKDVSISGTWDTDINFSFGSNTLDPALDLYNKAVDQYGDMYGYDSISGLSDIAGMYKGMQQDYQSKATLIIKPVDVFNNYEATFKYTTGAPDETFDGKYDPSTMKLLLKPRDKNVTDSGGNSYNLGQYGLQADVNIQIKAQKDNSGKSVLTFTGESANDPNNKIVSYSMTMTGTKVSDKYE